MKPKTDPFLPFIRAGLTSLGKGEPTAHLLGRISTRLHACLRAARGVHMPSSPIAGSYDTLRDRLVAITQRDLTRPGVLEQTQEEVQALSDNAFYALYAMCDPRKVEAAMFDLTYAEYTRRNPPETTKNRHIR